MQTLRPLDEGMRRTAAILLSLAVVLTSVPWLLTGEGGMLLVLPPIALLIFACVGRSRRHHAAQAVGSLWLFLLAAWGLVTSIQASRFYVASATQAIPILGLAVVSCLEAGVFARRPASDRRLVAGLLLIQASGYLTWAVCYLIVPGQLTWMAPPKESFLWQFAYPAGLGSAFLVTAWGVWACQRWSPWIGAAVTGWLAGVTLWYLARLVFEAESSRSFLGFACLELPGLALELTSAFFLARLAWRERRAPSHSVA